MTYREVSRNLFFLLISLEEEDILRMTWSSRRQLGGRDFLPFSFRDVMCEYIKKRVLLGGGEEQEEKKKPFSSRLFVAEERENVSPVRG